MAGERYQVCLGPPAGIHAEAAHRLVQHFGSLAFGGGGHVSQTDGRGALPGQWQRPPGEVAGGPVPGESVKGDQQDQWQLQFLLNRVDFGMTIQAAIEAPKFSSEHFPEFFIPRSSVPSRLRIEPLSGRPVLDELTRRGHDLEIAGDWTEGFLLAATREAETGLLEAGCDLRTEKSEVFPSFALCW